MTSLAVITVLQFVSQDLAAESGKQVKEPKTMNLHKPRAHEAFLQGPNTPVPNEQPWDSFQEASLQRNDFIIQQRRTLINIWAGAMQCFIAVGSIWVTVFNKYIARR